jgi:hypothetical protein
VFEQHHDILLQQAADFRQRAVRNGFALKRPPTKPAFRSLFPPAQHELGCRIDPLRLLDVLKLLKNVAHGLGTLRDFVGLLFSVRQGLSVTNALIDLAILRDAVNQPFRGSHLVVRFSHPDTFGITPV